MYISVILFFKVMAKRVAVLEITEKHATENMHFSLSENSRSSEVFKYIYFNKIAGLTFAEFWS